MAEDPSAAHGFPAYADWILGSGRMPSCHEWPDRCSDAAPAPATLTEKIGGGVILVVILAGGTGLALSRLRRRRRGLPDG